MAAPSPALAANTIPTWEIKANGAALDSTIQIVATCVSQVMRTLRQRAER